MPSSEPTVAKLPLAPGLWRIDPGHSSVGFTIRHLGVSKVRGRFTRFDARVQVGETLASTMVEATVELDSIDTGNADRDAHVRSPELLDVARRPLMTFRSTAVEGGGDSWVLLGELTIGDVTGPFTLDVDFGGVEAFLDGHRHAGFEAHGQLRRRDFGLDFELPPGASVLLGDAVKVEIDVQLVEPSVVDGDAARA